MTVRLVAPPSIGALVLLACWGCGGIPETPGAPSEAGPVATPGTVAFLPPVPIVPLGDRLASDNLVQNGGFEQPVTAGGGHEIPWWTVSAPGSVSVGLTEDIVAEGRYALRMGMHANDAVTATQQIQVPAGELFVLRGLFYAEDLSGSLFLSGRGGDPTDAEIQQGARAELEVDGAPAAWWLGQCEFLSPQSPARMADITVRCGYSPGAEVSRAGALYLDGVELYRLSTTQCVTYGDFESATDVGKVGSWSDDEFILRSEDAFEGKYALELAHDPARETLLTGVIGNGEALRGKRVWLSAMVKAPGAGSAADKAVTLRMRFLVNGQRQYESITHPGGGEYVELNLSATVPNDLGPDVNPFTLQLVRGRGVEGPVLIDNVSVLTKAAP